MTLPSISVSQRLAAAFAGQASALPPAVAQLCDALLMDVTGLCVAARHSDYMRAALQASAEPGTCTAIGHAGSFNVATAALCNGTAAHGEDYDDTFEGGPVHAGAVIVPAVLAAAEAHGLSGADIERGIAVGCELMCRLCLVAPKRVHQAGFHPTAVFGALGAAAGVASALRLPDAQWFNALGIAGSMASGIIEYLAEGAWTKRMHPGKAAETGVAAAYLAQAGMTGPSYILESEWGGFFATYCGPHAQPERLLEQLGESNAIALTGIKPYACCRASHGAIDPARSTDMVPYHSHADPQALTPNEIYKFEISLEPMAYLIKQGHRLRVEIVNGDSPATEILWSHYYRPDKIGSDTIHHDALHPSELILPVSPAPI